jgi:hypothetical protein
MTRRLFRDSIVRAALVVWAGTAAVYFVPGISHTFLERLGDRYSTLPLWPWTAAACVYGLGRVKTREERRFWFLQAASFMALLAIEVPWALDKASVNTTWNIVMEWCYFTYYACQLMSGTRTRAGTVGAACACAAAAAALSIMALTYLPMYDSAWPSYLTYLAFDAAMAAVFWRCRRVSPRVWSSIFAGLVFTSALVFVTDALDMFSYVEWIRMPAGMKTDILWTLPPLCYVLVVRVGRQRLEAPA